MIDEKKWYHSRTIWGALVAVAASIAGFMGVTIEHAAQTELTDGIMNLLGAVGALIAIYGRLSATDVIG